MALLKFKNRPIHRFGNVTYQYQSIISSQAMGIVSPRPHFRWEWVIQFDIQTVDYTCLKSEMCPIHFTQCPYAPTCYLKMKRHDIVTCISVYCDYYCDMIHFPGDGGNVENSSLCSDSEVVCIRLFCSVIVNVFCLQFTFSMQILYFDGIEYSCWSTFCST